MWHDWRAILHQMAHIQSQRWKLPLSWRCSTKSSCPCISGEQEGKKTWLLCAQNDGSHVYSPYLANSRYVTAHITYQWQRCNALQKSNGNLTLIIVHFWFTFESLFDCIRWIFDTQKKPRSEYISAELESSPFLGLPCTSIYRLIIQSENENWSLKHLYLNKEREADYECSKCNFYYTSIILLLITDSFSPCSSSKTRSYSIHVHTEGKRNWQGYLKCLICGGIILLLKRNVTETKVYFIITA